MGDNLIATRVWRSLDRTGLEHCRLFPDGLSGDVIVDRCFFSYRVIVDGQWRTQSLRVEGFVNGERYALALDAPFSDGCVDVDLAFTPSTNTLPIRRLGLAAGEEAPVSAIWLRYPELRLERLDQVYRRTGELTWQYTSATGFTGVLEVDEHGMVRSYEDGWEEVRG